MLGGSTTSLLSLLGVLDYDKYEVDLLFLTDNKTNVEKVPPQVNILPIAHKYQSAKRRKIWRMTSIRYLWHYAISKFITWKNKNRKYGEEYLVRKDLEPYRKLEKEYDVAIGFLEGYSNIYLIDHVKAKKKIGWVHIDLMASNFNPAYDKPIFEKLDNIVVVSNKCLESFKKYCPECAEKGVVIENILTQEYAQKMAQEDARIEGFDKDKINLFTCCRISFTAKGLDRATRVFAKLKNENLIEDVRWYILGEGSDRPILEQMIKDFGLEKNIILLGAIDNPYKYLKQADLFFLPSIWEGKPMAVTEAQLLGIPAFVTEYASAHEQVRDGVDGIVVKNDEESIYEGLKKLLLDLSVLDKLGENTKNTNYSNLQEVEKVYELF